MERQTWWLTRPTRDLHDLDVALKSFAGIAKGKKWRENEELHRRFELENPAKTSNAGQYGSRGSGGRTWAAWLRMWGMWYDEDDVKLTDAGELVASARSARDVHNQIVHMIMTFQITSAYHGSPRVRQAPDFRVFPFRFTLRLLLDERVGYLDTDEITLFLLSVKTHDEYGSVVKKIVEWRKERSEEDRRELKTRLMGDHARKYGRVRKDSPGTVKGHWRAVKDVANTLIMNISYIAELRYDNRKGTVYVRKEDRKKAAELLAKYEGVPFSTLYVYSDAMFMRKFGIRYDRRKASRKETRPMTPAKKRHERISKAVAELKKTGETAAGSDLVRKIQERTNEPEEAIERVLAENPEIVLDGDGDEFARHYLACAKDGARHAEFEQLTRKIFDLMGFETRKMKIRKTGGGTPEIDGLILDAETGLSGLLECKGGAKYTFPIGDCRKMERTYIENFRTKRIKSTEYALDFFVYVVGSEAGGLDNFREIVQNSGVRGSVIYAGDLVRLYDLVKGGRITRLRAWELFKSNSHVSWRTVGDLGKR